MHNDFGTCLIAIRLLLKDIHNKDVSVSLVSAYVLVSNAPDDVWDKYLNKLTTCIKRKRNLDVLIIGTDANSRMGTASARGDGPLYCFGLNYVNKSGKRFQPYLSIKNLSIITTFLKKNQYSASIHRRSKNTHQIDPFLLTKKCFTVVLMLVLHESC